MGLVEGPGWATRTAKAAVDLVGGLVLAVLLLPLICLIAVTIRLSLGPDVIFRQVRIGLNGEPFVVFKFRTMAPDRRSAVDGPAPAVERRLTHKTTADPRHTRLGCVLRKYSLDELPQVVNILRREMSLVGPRPELPSIVAKYEPWACDRHLVRPGLTGLWQILARGEGMMQDFVSLDIDYVRRASLTLDLMILARTIPALLRHRGT